MARLINFKMKEFTCKCGCGRTNMDDAFLEKLQTFRTKVQVPLIVTCGGRCKKHNKDVGGVAKSLHINEGKKATAVDVTTKDCARLYTVACSCGFFNEVEYHIKKNFVHLGIDPNQKGNSFKIIKD